ncbi:MAG: hypothetical protein Q8P52_00520 [bacterium]|nr:hypothetical protein [bacterium]
MKALLSVTLFTCLFGCVGHPDRVDGWKKVTYLPSVLGPIIADIPVSTGTFTVTNSFTIVLEEPETIRKIGLKSNIPNALGLCLIEERELLVPFSGGTDKNGRPLPDFETLGHEVWHLLELGGKWHD